jgi:hypothetical protein
MAWSRHSCIPCAGTGADYMRYSHSLSVFEGRAPCSVALGAGGGGAARLSAGGLGTSAALALAGGGGQHYPVAGGGGSSGGAVAPSASGGALPGPGAASSSSASAAVSALSAAASGGLQLRGGLQAVPTALLAVIVPDGVYCARVADPGSYADANRDVRVN